jgi:hypothetical protein
MDHGGSCGGNVVSTLFFCAAAIRDEVRARYARGVRHVEPRAMRATWLVRMTGKVAQAKAFAVAGRGQQVLRTCRAERNRGQ